VELVAIAVASAKTLVALARLVQRIEIHNQIKFVVRIVGYPGIGIGIVGARFIQNRKRFAMAGGRHVYRESQHHHRRQAGCDHTSLPHIEFSPFY
jgi:hypothetical protein